MLDKLEIKDFLIKPEVKTLISENLNTKLMIFSNNFNKDNKVMKIYFNPVDILSIKSFSEDLFNRIRHFLPFVNYKKSNSIGLSIKQNFNKELYKYIHIKFLPGFKMFKPELNSNLENSFVQGVSVDNNNNTINFKKYFYFNDEVSKKRLSEIFKKDFSLCRTLEYTEENNNYKIIALTGVKYDNILCDNQYALNYAKQFEGLLDSKICAAGLYNKNIYSIYFENCLNNLFKI